MNQSGTIRHQDSLIISTATWLGVFILSHTAQVQFEKDALILDCLFAPGHKMCNPDYSPGMDLKVALIL